MLCSFENNKKVQGECYALVGVILLLMDFSCRPLFSRINTGPEFHGLERKFLHLDK